LKHIY